MSRQETRNPTGPLHLLLLAACHTFVRPIILESGSPATPQRSHSFHTIRNRSRRWIAGSGPTRSTAISWATPDETLTWSASPGDGERALARAFFAAVRSGETGGLRQSFDDAMRTHRLVMAANASAERGEPVRL